MCVPSLNDICESIFELLRTQVQTYGCGGITEVKPVYPLTSICEYKHCLEFQILLRYSTPREFISIQQM